MRVYQKEPAKEHESRPSHARTRNPVIETIDETSSVETKSIIILITFKLTPRERASSSDSDQLYLPIKY